MRYSAESQEKILVSKLVTRAKLEPVVLVSEAGEEAVVLSKESYDLLAAERQQKLDNFRVAWKDLSYEATRNGLREEKLAEILND